jgi:hypothetical protein
MEATMKLQKAGRASYSDRRRSLKRRYLHLQVAGRSQVLSGSGGRSADNKRKFASDRAASHAPSPAITSAPPYFRILLFQTTMTQLLGGADQRWSESGAGGSGPVEPWRFADTCGMASRRLFARSARKALARSARASSRRRRATTTDATAIITRRNVNKISFIPQSPTELRRYASIQVVAAGQLVGDHSQSLHEFGRQYPAATD